MVSAGIFMRGDMELSFLGVLFLSGVALAACYVLLLTAAYIWVRVSRWVDDDEGPPKRNPIVKWIMLRRGFVELPRDEVWAYERPQKGNQRPQHSDGEFALIPIPVLIWTPFACWLAVKFYPIALAAGVLVLLAHLARFARRHKKLFDKHLKDPMAHKG